MFADQISAFELYLGSVFFVFILTIGSFILVRIKENSVYWFVAIAPGFFLFFFSLVVTEGQHMSRCQAEIATISWSNKGQPVSFEVEVDGCRWRSRDDIFGPFGDELTVKPDGFYKSRF